MPAPDELYPPVQYEWWWLAIAVGVIVALAAIGWILWAATRPRRDPPPPPPVPLGQQLDALRAHHLNRIATVERSYAAGAVSAREANAELSSIARAFVNEYTGLETPVLTLGELETSGASGDLVDAVRTHFYPGVYESATPQDLEHGIAAARRVVTGWH